MTKEFLKWLSLLCHGTTQEKLQWAFQLYDINHDGFVTRKEMTEIICSIYALIGRRSSATDERPLRDHVDRIFEVGKQYKICYFILDLIESTDEE